MQDTPPRPGGLTTKPFQTAMCRFLIISCLVRLTAFKYRILTDLSANGDGGYTYEHLPRRVRVFASKGHAG